MKNKELIKRNNRYLSKLLMILLIVFFSMLIKNTAYAVGTGYVTTVGKEITSADVNQITITRTKMKVSDNLKPSGDTNKWVTTNNSGYSTGNGDMHYLANNTTYTITYEDAFKINNVNMTLVITIKPTQTSANSSSYVSFGLATNNEIDIYNNNSKATISYRIQNSSGNTVNDYFCYGFEDPDGGNYLFTSGDNTNYDIYWKAPNSSNSSFANSYKVDSAGIKRQAYTYDFNQALFLIAYNTVHDSTFSISWSTTEGGGGDWLDLPRLYYAPGLSVYFHMNGGSLASTHGATYSTSGNYVTNNGSKIIHWLKSGDSLGNNGLANYNNANYMNIVRAGYHAIAGSEYNTKADGTGTTLNQTTNYSYSTLSGYGVVNGILTLYVKWVLNRVNIEICLNGGYLANPHRSDISTVTDGDKVFATLDGSRTMNSVEYGSTLDEYGLWNYNTTALNVKRLGYTVNTTEAYRNRTSGSTNYNRLYDQDAVYAASDFDDCSNSDKTVQLYIKWIPINYNINYILNGGQNASGTPTTYNIETDDINISNPTRAGYIFNGWQKTVSNLEWAEGFLAYTTGEVGTVSSYPNSYYSGYIHLKAGVTYTMSGYGDYSPEYIRWRVYDTNGSYLGGTNSIAGNTYTPTQDVLVRILMYENNTDVQRNGVVITGTENESTVSIPTGSVGNITLTAQWIPNTATVTVRKDYSDWEDWESNGIKVALYQGGSEKYTYAAGSKSGATISWSGVEEGTYNIYASKSALDTSTMVDTQDYLIINGLNSESINYLSVKVHRGTGIESVSGGGPYLNLQNATIDAIVKPGYTWRGWTNCDCGENNCFCDPCDCEIMTTEKLHTLPVQWEIINRTAEATLNTYTISYNLDGGSVAGTNPTSYTVEDNDITLINPTKSGYTFIGWTGTGLSSNTMTVTIPHGSIGDRAYVANWEANTATITIKRDNANWNENSRIKLELKQSGTTKYSATASSSTVLWNGVIPGTYDIYASKNQANLNSLEDTGVDVIVTSSGTATIDYYTLTLQKGIGISAVTGGGTFLKGQTANIDATVAAGYTWQGWSVVSGNSPD